MPYRPLLSGHHLTAQDPLNFGRPEKAARPRRLGGVASVGLGGNDPAAKHEQHESTL